MKSAAAKPSSATIAKTRKTPPTPQRGRMIPTMIGPTVAATRGQNVAQLIPRARMRVG
jgi:hypothetical protein